ncbi:replication-relaxation family protein [Labedaea rhizosphaerae]|uniref:Protein involved in plasmid replication-relaxation n=1 Tax=Labedaea rhizosphaerae TaxID=598644 RepID=A0A4R6SAF3_LABRH|nr:replication-relaxation family protein [Labedaea rhizosphaerae]TDP96387.1 protein involved in plasmid replication-relaxation [Labedaea rhizosphaerae]
MSGRGRASRLAKQLSPRDFAVLRTLEAMRLMTGQQLGRLHVEGGQPTTQARKTRAMLQRLTTLGLVIRLRRRVGGVRAGSDGVIYGLSGLGQAVLDLGRDTRRRHRRVNETKPAFQNHTLAVSDVLVQLVDRARAGRAELLGFTNEPQCWRRFSGIAGQMITLKPDAFVRIGVGGYEISAFLEVDLDSESAPTIARKLVVYVAYWRSGTEQRRRGVVPKTWWLVPDTARLQSIARVIGRLPQEEQALFTVGLLPKAADLLTQAPSEGGAS